MKMMNSIEYYTSCPSCGASNKGKDICDYCGTLLIKKEVQQPVFEERLSQEECYAREDAGLPVIHGKKAGRNPFLLIFCPIFGGCFFVIPFFIMIGFMSVGLMPIWVILMLVMFMAGGIGAFVPLILNIVNTSKCKNGVDIYGVVRGYEDSMMMVNGKPILNVILRVEYANGPHLVIVGTGETRKSYALGQTVKLKNYNDYYMVV